MPIIKCKMCGGDLNIVEDSTVCECEYCGTKQTVPKVDDEKKLKLFERANRLRTACEFDKAAGVYESIVADFDEEAEAYWGLILCKFGIEYVDDPATGNKIPTCHRSSFDSLMDDPNFDMVMECADPIARKVYREEAKQIEELRKRIIEVSSQEEPYDVFISYKELDDEGQRTLDSVIAQDIYSELTERGYRVFFSRISLEDKLGVEYEPYIFAALNSAKVMLVVGTDYDHFNAVWVKNEWSRFLMLIASGQKKTLIPVYKGIDAYDMPKEFRKLAAQDMGKVGAMQDLVRGVEKLLGKKGAAVESPKEQPIIVQSGGPNVAALLDRGVMALEDEDWDKAEEFFDQILNMDSRNGDAFLGMAMVEARCRTREDFWNVFVSPHSFWRNNKYLARTKLYGNEQLRLWLAKMDKEAQANDLAKKDADDALAREAAQKAADEERKSREKQIEREKKIPEYTSIRKKQQKARQMIAAGEYHSVGVMLNGRVISSVYCGNQYDDRGQCNISSWEDIVAVAAGMFHTVGLRADGTVSATTFRDDDYNNIYDGQCAVSGWRDIVSIAAGSCHTVGLKENGQVVAVGSNNYGQCDVSNWKNIIAIAAGPRHTVGLTSDGTVITTGTGITLDWKNIVAISAGLHTVGLNADGTVVSTYGKIPDWEDIVAVSAGDTYTVGLKSNGTVVAMERPSTAWYYDSFTCEFHGQDALSHWTDIVAISAGRYHVLGLKRDGTVVVTKIDSTQSYNHGQCEISGWKLFGNYESIGEEQKSRIVKERNSVQTELSALHGLFTGKRRKELEARLFEIENMLKFLQ